MKEVGTTITCIVVEQKEQSKWLKFTKENKGKQSIYFYSCHHHLSIHPFLIYFIIYISALIVPSSAPSPPPTIIITTNNTKKEPISHVNVIWDLIITTAAPANFTIIIITVHTFTHTIRRRTRYLPLYSLLNSQQLYTTNKQ